MILAHGKSLIFIRNTACTNGTTCYVLVAGLDIQLLQTLTIKMRKFMTKIRLNTTHRNILKEYGQAKIKTLIDRTRQDKLYAAILEAANKAISNKYPEKDMAVLRKYKLVRTNYCLKFQFPSGRVDGFTFNWGKNDPTPIDMPARSGCVSNDVFPMDKDFEAAYDEYAKVLEANKLALHAKERQFDALIDSAKTLEDVLDIIELPPEILERLGRKSTALVALSSETLESLKADFTLKAA
jgi:hypothetical protein